MAQSSKEQVTAKLSALKKKALQTAFDALTAQYAPVLAKWNQATPEQREKFLEHSPILKAILDWSKQWVQ